MIGVPPAGRRWGDAPAVICLHATGSSSRQWGALVEGLCGHYGVHAADLIGHGQSPGWRGEAPNLEREAARVAPLIMAEPTGVHLVGHSYGGAVALKLALAMPGRVRSLTLYEPVMFQLLLEADDPGGAEAAGVAGEIRRAFDAGCPEDSARVFFDYWSGAGTFSRLKPEQRASLAGRMATVIDCFLAIFGDSTRAADLACLDVPALLMNGTASPLSGRAATECVSQLLPQSRRHEFDRLGHMGPVVRPDTVNTVIAEFLAEVAGQDVGALAA